MINWFARAKENIMKIDKQIIGGNIEVLEIDGDRVRVERELRDTRPDRDWFYWAFRVTGAAGRTVTFEFPHKNRVGYFGAAVSPDQIHWSWSGKRKITVLEDESRIESFTYTFGEDENETYFAHDMVYVPARFEQFCAANGLAIEELCLSNKGRSVPFTRFGSGDRKILLTSRHHACESTGTHVMESVLQSFIDEPLEGYEIVCVPFVDYDGVLDGDQGKHRLPHDHNRDYPLDGSESLYTSCAAIRRFVEENRVPYAFDFHSPKHLGKLNNKVSIIYKLEEKVPELRRFAELFSSKITSDAFPYDPENDMPPNTGWNLDTSETFARYLLERPESRLAFTLETPYFGEKDGSAVVTEASLSALGKSFAAALRDYISHDCPALEGDQ